MKRIYLILWIVLLGLASLQSQVFSAGPDQTICSGVGADLGDPTQTIPSSWCITWTPAEGLDNPHAAQPHATPKYTTVYVATVLTDDWQSISTDEVKITVGFGGIKFTPPYLNQGSETTSKAIVTINPDNDMVTWSVEGESLGCSIDPMTGVITPGTEYGKITVRATKTEDEECFAEEEIDINEGTKDISARDFDHAGRIAIGDVDTLTLVGESAAVITAIPNETGFAPEHPFWYTDGDPHTVEPADGINDIVTGVTLGDNYKKFIAGSQQAGYEPRIVVVHLSSDELVIDLGPLIQKFTEKLNALNEFLKSKIAKKFPQVPNLSVEVAIAQMKYKKNKAELYNNPGWGYKYTVEAGGQIKLSGKLYYPPWTGTIEEEGLDFVLGSELYIEPYFETSLTGSVIKDPSKEDSGWTASNPIKSTTTGGIRGVFNVYGQSSGYKVTGGFSLASEISADVLFYLTNGKLTLKFTVAPLQGNTKIVVEHQVDPKWKYSFFDYTVDLFDKWVSPEFELYDFGAQQ